MSDSDDTDILLLIPPNFFFVNSRQDHELDKKSISCFECGCSASILNDHCLRRTQSSMNHYHLPKTQQNELDTLNLRISQMENDFAPCSDVSSVSNITVRSRINSEMPNNNSNRNSQTPKAFIHSTPKLTDYQIINNSPQRNKMNTCSDDGILLEIEKFLDEKKSNSLFPSDYQCRSASVQNTDLPQNLQFNSERNSQIADWLENRDNDHLLSLSDIWENNKEVLSIQEERIRRQHCEKIIQSLQSKLLQYQQKISVAVQIDKTKDAALKKLQDENLSLQTQNGNLEQNLKTLRKEYNVQIEQLKVDMKEMKISKECLEKELAQALDLASKFQDKNEALEIEMKNLFKETNVYKAKIENLESKVSSYAELEEVKQHLSKSQHDLEMVTNQLNKYKKEIESYQNEKEIINDKIRQEKHRCDSLDKQNRNLSVSISELSCKERNLIKELEIQRNALKSHYQQQLESVVQQKLIEFQEQLDEVETNLSREAKNRERLIADRAIKQLEMINEKNEQEIALIIEKHHKEVELYRIQQINSNKKIQDLDEKLDLYRNRRVDMAEKLHTVMEAQWQKTLEILTSPSNPIVNGENNVKQLDTSKLDGVQKTKAENEEFNTPTSSRHRTYRVNDRLQAYIEMLLTKSPRDLENLDEILAMPKNNSMLSPKGDKSKSQKPPWK